MSIRWRSDWNPLLSTHPRWIYDYGFSASFDSSYSVWAVIHRVGGITQTPALSPNMDCSHFMLPERRDPLLLLLCCCCCFFLTNTAVIPINSTLHPFYRTTTSRLAGHVRPCEEEERFVGWSDPGAAVPSRHRGCFWINGLLQYGEWKHSTCPEILHIVLDKIVQ